MALNCPRCGGELLNDEAAVCDGCIAEDVAISFEDGSRDEDPNDCPECGDSLNVYGVCPGCED